MGWLYLLRLLSRGASGVWDCVIFVVALAVLIFFLFFILSPSRAYCGRRGKGKDKL
jgi:hypothetical protein